MYFELLQKWNSKMNLMSIDNWDEFYEKHVVDALYCLEVLKGSSSMIDLGSGAGVPAIPIKIETPRLEVVMLDSTRKKISFCEEVIRTLSLDNITAVWGRAEDEGLMRGLGAFDVVISRATWDLKKFLSIGFNYVRIGGRIVAMKGPGWTDEEALSESTIDSLGLKRVNCLEYALAGGEKRALLVYERQGSLIEEATEEDGAVDL